MCGHSCRNGEVGWVSLVFPSSPTLFGMFLKEDFIFSGLRPLVHSNCVYHRHFNLCALSLSNSFLCACMGLVVQKMDSTIHWINHYPVDKYEENELCYPVDRDLFNGWHFSPFEQLRPGNCLTLNSFLHKSVPCTKQWTTTTTALTKTETDSLIVREVVLIVVVDLQTNGIDYKQGYFKY